MIQKDLSEIIEQDLQNLIDNSVIEKKTSFFHKKDIFLSVDCSLSHN